MRHSIVLAVLAAAPAFAAAPATAPATGTKALSHFGAAAQGGNLDAMNSIGFMYSDGVGVAKDEKQAFAWFTKAATLGHAEATYNLASAHHTGAGTAKALFWAQAAADKGHAEAVTMVKVLQAAAAKPK